MGHSVLPPSAAAHWGSCAGWLQVCGGLPNIESEATRRGAASHWVGASTLLSVQGRAALPLTCRGYVGMTAPNGVRIDEELADGAAEWVRDVLNVCQQLGALRELRVEETLSIAGVHPVIDGTPDSWLWHPETRALYVWDYKSGHVPVEARCRQLALYARGAADAAGLDGHSEQGVTAHLRVVQPFAYDGRGTVRRWTGALTDLRADWNTLADMAARNLAFGLCKPGGHCANCNGVSVCAAARAYTHRVVESLEYSPTLDRMTPHDRAIELSICRDALEVLKDRAGALEEQLRADVAGGDVTAGLVLETAPGRRVWSAEPPIVRAALATLRIDPTKTDLRTPSQVINDAEEDARPIVESIVKSLSRRTAGSAKLVPVAESLTARAFSNSGE